MHPHFEVLLNTSASLPLFGLGTWRLMGNECTRVVQKALDLGYRHIDTARLYENHEAIQKGIAGYDREKLFLTTKFGLSEVQNETIEEACDRALRELGTDYLDLYLLHYPDRSYDLAQAMDETLSLVHKQKVRSVGVSNFTIRHLQDLFDRQIPVAVNQVEYHPYLNQKELLAFLFAFLSNIVYYFGLVAGLRFASPTLTVMVLGMVPIVIALYGNWREKEITYRALAIPCLWIGLGLVLVNAVEIDWSFKATSIGRYLIGLVGIIISLFAWSWYAVHNSRFLKRHPQIPANEWTTVLGVATLAWAFLFAVFFVFWPSSDLHLSKILYLSSASLRYWGGVTILGVICSWVGCFLWSRASLHLPISLMGPLLIFETLFGLLFVFFTCRIVAAV